jgi:hypothetical protein
LSNILNIAGKLVLFYLGLGILIWFIQFSSGIYFEQIYRTGTYPNGWACRGGQAVAAYKLLGFDASGPKQILLWGPTLYAAQGQGMGIGDVLVPTECAAAGEISAGASRCFCDVRVEGSMASRRVIKWAPAGKECTDIGLCQAP